MHHHAEVAPLEPDEQDRWLRLAAENRWSKSELRRQLRAAKSGSANGRPGDVLVRVQVDSDRRQNWQAAADQAHRSLEEWMLATLDAAASTTVLVDSAKFSVAP
jgi:hypothetical protein